jgi:DNA adenine methylase
MDLWKAIIGTPEALAESYHFLWHDQEGREKEYFNHVRERFNRLHEPADFLYLLARCVKAAIRYNSRGEFNNTPDNRRKGARPEEMRNRLVHASSLFNNRVRLTSKDYLEILDECTPNDLVYMDPPYQGVCRNRDQRYCPPFDHSTFCRAIEKLNSRNIRFIISYDGRTGEKIYGEPIPANCHLTRFEIFAGCSSQATLLGRREETFESLYLSPNLATSMPARSRKPVQRLFWQ